MASERLRRYDKEKKKTADLARKQTREDSTTGGSQLTEGQPDNSHPADDMDYDQLKGIKKEKKPKQKRKGSDEGYDIGTGQS